MSFSAGSYLSFPPEGFTLKWYKIFWNSPNWLNSLRVSIEIALMTTSISLAIGVPAAFTLARKTSRYIRLVLFGVTIPIAFPVVVSAVALYYVFGPLHLVGTKLGLSLAHSTLSIPIVVLPLRAILLRFDERLEWQAITLGASRFRAFWTITLPLLKVPLLTVSLFAFITSFDEVVFALFLGSGTIVTVPKRVWEGLRFDIEPTVAVVATIIVLVASLVLINLIILDNYFAKRLNKSYLKEDHGNHK